MNNRKRTLITIVCSILLIMPSFLGVPLADGNLVVISTPDSGQVNDEISTNTDLKDYNIKTTVTRELLLGTDSYETALSDSGKIQKHIVTMENGNDDNSNTSIFVEQLGAVESHQFSESYVATEPTLIPETQAAAENTSETTSFWPLIPSYGGVGNATDNVGLLAGPETLPRDPLNGTLGVVTINETTFTPTPELSAINASQPIFDTLTADQNYMIIYGADLTFNTSDSSQHSILAGDGETNTEQVVSSADALSEPPITTDYIGSAIAENSTIHIDVLANSPDTNNSSLVVSSTIQGVHETITYNHDENTAFSSENTMIGASDSSSSDSVNITVNTNSGSSGDGNKRSSHASSDESDHNSGQCSSNPVSHDGQDKHGDDVEGIGGVHDGHHADSESTHYNDTGVSHKDSEHENREGSDDDRDHNDHEDGGQNNHENSDHDDNGQHGDQNDE